MSLQTLKTVLRTKHGMKHICTICVHSIDLHYYYGGLLNSMNCLYLMINFTSLHKLYKHISVLFPSWHVFPKISATMHSQSLLSVPAGPSRIWAGESRGRVSELGMCMARSKSRFIFYTSRQPNPKGGNAARWNSAKVAITVSCGPMESVRGWQVIERGRRWKKGSRGSYRW